MRIKKRHWYECAAFCLLLATAALTGCDQSAASGSLPVEEQVQSSAPAPSKKKIVVDDLRREVEVPAQPVRIAATASFISELLTELGAPPIVRPAVDERNVYPEAAKSIPTIVVSHVGGPNMEQLAAAQPDLVITAPPFARFVEPIEKGLSVPVLVYDVRNLADLSAKIKAFGELVGRREQAQQLAQRIQGEIDAITKDIPKTGSPRVLALFGTPEGFFVFRPESYAGSMIKALGGELVATQGDPVSRSPQFATFNMEVAVQADPDLILVIRHGGDGDGQALLSDHPTWATMRAVKDGRVHLLSQWLYLSNPGPRATEALNELRGLLYPAEPK